VANGECISESKGRPSRSVKRSLANVTAKQMLEGRAKELYQLQGEGALPPKGTTAH
jgi:hypothetical protein